MADGRPSTDDLYRTPLYFAHLRLGARMVPFAGWLMPLHYPTGILQEHHAVRQSAGLFDLSHMGRLWLRGARALDLVRYCLSRDLPATGRAGYALLCREDGGILDDLVAYPLSSDEVLLVVNAANRAKDLAWLTRQRDTLGLAVDIADETSNSALLGIQGPRAQAVLQALGPENLDEMLGFSFQRTTLAGHPVLLSRTGYTGEDGFEALAEASASEALWEALLSGASQAMPCGLGARDTLRTEAAMPLYGHEIDEATNPYEAGLGGTVQLGRADFAGRSALLELSRQAPSRRLVGLLPEPGGVPRQGFPITMRDDGVGRVTSGLFSPTLRRAIALGYVASDAASAGQTLSIDVRGRALPASLTPLPFVPRRARARAKKP